MIISYYFRLIDRSKMAAQLFSPSISGGIFDFSKKSTFCSSKNGQFSQLGCCMIKKVDAKDSRNGWMRYSINDLAFKNMLNLQSKRQFLSTRVGYLDSENVTGGRKVENDENRRLSRLTRSDAQNALFDYLHCTRSLNFADAEHMSRNSPVFLHNMMMKIEHQHDVGHSLTRFLRYHPINEFEPFFESLGLMPAEIVHLLPRNLMFLSDDNALLENYHVLCNYGIPRCKIGRIYKEGTGVFGYEYGVLADKLDAYQKLGLSKPTIIKLVTCCPILLVGDMNSEFLHVQEKLKSLGVELDGIRGCFSDKSSYSWIRILEMLDLLQRMGFSKTDMASLIVKHPRLVFEDSGKKIYILLTMLLKLGIRMKDVMVLLVQHPQILEGNFTKNLWESVTFLAEIGMEMEVIAEIVSSHAHVLGASSCRRPIVVLKDLNQSASSLCDILKKDPSQFGNLVSKRRNNSLSLPKSNGIFLKEKTTFLLKLGYVENSDEMAKALRKFRGRGDQLQERFDCLVNAGLDCHTVCEMIKLAPQILNQSSRVIEQKIDYLFNHLGYPAEALAVFPAYLCYNIEKVKLRFSMYNWLVEQGILLSTKNRKMINSTAALSTLLACSEARFMKYVVNAHPEGPKQWEKLKSSSA